MLIPGGLSVPPGLPLGPGRGGRAGEAPAGRAKGLTGEAGNGDQGEGRGHQGWLNLSPRTVDAQVRLQSGRYNRGTFSPRAWGQREPKNNSGGCRQRAYIERISKHFGRTRNSTDIARPSKKPISAYRDLFPGILGPGF
jgi:hypothetical protein